MVHRLLVQLIAKRARVLIGAALWCAYAVIWVVGVGGHLLWGGTPPNARWAAPLFLLLAALVVVASAPRDWPSYLISVLAGFTAEAIGVATTYPFGAYTYTDTLAPSLLGVPFAIAAAWMILIAWVRQLAFSPWAGALVMCVFDLIIDPLAAGVLGFWKWQASGPYYGVPVQNFVGWFLVSFLILFILRRAPERNASVLFVGCTIAIFFGLVALAHGFFVPTLLGILLCGAGYARWRSSKVLTRI